MLPGTTTLDVYAPNKAGYDCEALHLSAGNKDLYDYFDIVKNPKGEYVSSQPIIGHLEW